VSTLSTLGVSTFAALTRAKLAPSLQLKTCIQFRSYEGVPMIRSRFDLILTSVFILSAAPAALAQDNGLGEIMGAPMGHAGTAAALAEDGKAKLLGNVEKSWGAVLEISRGNQAEIEELVDKATKRCNADSLRALEEKHGVKYAEIKEMIEADKELAEAEKKLRETSTALDDEVKKWKVPATAPEMEDVIFEDEIEHKLQQKKLAMAYLEQNKARKFVFLRDGHESFAQPRDPSTWSKEEATFFQVNGKYYRNQSLLVINLPEIDQFSSAAEIDDYLTKVKQITEAQRTGHLKQIVGNVSEYTFDYSDPNRRAYRFVPRDVGQIYLSDSVRSLAPKVEEKGQKIAIFKKHLAAAKVREPFEKAVLAAKERVLKSRVEFEAEGTRATKLKGTHTIVSFLQRHSDKLLTAAAVCPVFLGGNRDKVLSEREISGVKERAFQSHGF
jgi:hypothetical protein